MWPSGNLFQDAAKAGGDLVVATQSFDILAIITKPKVMDIKGYEHRLITRSPVKLSERRLI
jgi:hypothetical protein